MNKSVPKKMRIGFELRVNPSGEVGESKWIRVGNLFNSVNEAAEFRAKKYPNVTKYLIMGVKTTALPKIPARYTVASEKSETKKGTQNAS